MTNDELKIKIPDPNFEASKIYQQEVGEIKGILKLGIKTFNWIITFVIGVMLVGFLTLLFTVVNSAISSWQVYEESRHLQVQEQIINNTVTQQKILLDELKIIQDDIQLLKNRKN